jgi:hypothetical protein
MSTNAALMPTWRTPRSWRGAGRTPCCSYEAQRTGLGKIRRVMQAGYAVALALEWWDGGQPTTRATACATSRPAHDPRYSLRDIAAGRHDASFDRWLRAFRHLPRPLQLRPLHEFSGDWYPWAAYSPDYSVADFIPAWRRRATRLPSVDFSSPSRTE